ncbi:hypothetical protein LINPERHAP2_LOCUS15472 [Linum perenne]
MLTRSHSGIRNGRATRFWVDRWLESGVKLVDLVAADLNEINLDERVVDFVTKDGNLDLSRIGELLPTTSTTLIIGCSPPSDAHGEDVWIWGGEANGIAESVTHVLPNCSFPESVWSSFGSHSSDLRRDLNLEDWCMWLLKHDQAQILGITCWYLWKCRNELIFVGKDPPSSSLANRVSAWTKAITSSFSFERRS